MVHAPASRNFLVSAAGRALRGLFAARPAPAPAAVRSIVVIKPCCLGDVLMATPAISALRHGYPEARITVAVGRWSADALENNPDVDDVLDCGVLGIPGQNGWSSCWRFVREVRSCRFDLAVVLDRSAIAAATAWLAGIPYRAGIDSEGRGFSLTQRVRWRGPRHEVELYLDVVRALKIELDDPRLVYRPRPEYRTFAARLFEEWGLTGEAPVVAIHPGGAANPGMQLPAKRWPPARFAAVADRLTEEAGVRVLILGHGSDAQAARQTRAAMRRAAVDLVGQTSFGQMAAVIERCHLFIGNDSGPMHLAAAVGTPVLAILGPTLPEAYAPYRATGAVLFHADACPARRAGRPFRPGPVGACPDCRCIDAVHVEEAWQAAARLLAGGVRESRAATFPSATQ